MNSFVEHFIQSCQTAARETNRLQAMESVMNDTVRDPASIILALPASGEDEILLFHSAEITIYRVLVYHGLQYPPHEHGMPVVIGPYAGCETNMLYRRRERNPSTIEPTGRVDLKPSQVTKFGAEVIHSVSNLAQEPSAALHVYLGDLSAQKRSMWTLDLDGERQFDMEHYFAWSRRLSDRDQRPAAILATKS